MLSDDTVLSIVAAELSNQYGGQSTSGTSGNIPDLEASLDYYLGNPNGREVANRSQVTSTDVADAIEWIMPQIMKSFTQNNEIVAFDAVHPGDERQAAIETEYVYDVLMKQNDGFILIHQFVKDALMQRNGILKVYYADDTEMWTSDYTGINDQEFQVLATMPDSEIIERSEYIDEEAHIRAMAMYEQQMQQYQQAMASQGFGQVSQQQQPPPPQEPQPTMLYDVKVQFTSNKGRIVIDSIPPEEFRVNSDHNSICLDDAKFTAHVLDKTVSELMAEGVPEDVLKEIPKGSINYDTKYRFSAQNEDLIYAWDMDTEDWSQTNITVTEAYLLIDYDEDGISELCKVTLAGGDTPTKVLSIEQIGQPYGVVCLIIYMPRTIKEWLS